MKITGVSVQVVDAGVTMVFADRLIMNLANVIVRVQTDDGIEGVAGSSTYLGARAVAAALDELGYEWFEMPLRDQHIQAYKALADALDIAVTSGEVHTRTYQEAANYLTCGAWDMVRIDAVISGGITATKKTAALAEALGVRCEIHSFGYTLTQAANLQVMGAVSNCRYFEYPMPMGGYGAVLVDETR